MPTPASLEASNRWAALPLGGPRFPVRPLPALRVGQASVGPDTAMGTPLEGLDPPAGAASAAPAGRLDGPCRSQDPRTGAVYLLRRPGGAHALVAHTSPESTPGPGARPAPVVRGPAVTLLAGVSSMVSAANRCVALVLHPPSRHGRYRASRSCSCEVRAGGAVLAQPHGAGRRPSPADSPARPATAAHLPPTRPPPRRGVRRKRHAPGSRRTLRTARPPGASPGGRRHAGHAPHASRHVAAAAIRPVPAGCRHRLILGLSLR